MCSSDLHAERNCIYNACRHGTALDGCIAVVTMFPCADCARALIQAGVKTLVTVKPDMDDPRWGSEFAISLQMFQEVGMIMLYVDSTYSLEHNHHISGNMEV